MDGAGLNVGGTNGTAGGTGLLTVRNSGTVTAASVHAWKSGTLTGNGTVSTTSGTTIDGTLAPTGTLAISGDLGFGPGGTMHCNVSSSSWDKAEVSGTAPNTIQTQTAGRRPARSTRPSAGGITRHPGRGVK